MKRLAPKTWFIVAAVLWPCIPRAAGQSQGAAAVGNSEFKIPSNYVLGPDDQIFVHARDVEEISDDKPVRIDIRGNVNLPLAGRVKAAGLTADQLETELVRRLRRFLKEPEVVVSIAEFRSQPISVLGAVGTPGVHQLQGRKTLFEILSMAGGLKPEAGNTIKITRRIEWGRIPLATAVDDASGRYNVAEVGVKSIMTAKNPQENILIQPNDVISVPRADLVYVIGSVHKAGAFVLGERESLSALQALALAEGLERTAAPQHAKILRPIEGSTARTEIAVDLKKILAGKANDLALKADDILFVPNSAAKNAALRSMEAAIGMASGVGTGLIIYRR